MSFNTVVSFVRDGPVIGTFNFPISADDVAFEAVEREVLSFTGSSPSPGVNLGPSTVATITDQDGKHFSHHILILIQFLFLQRWVLCLLIAPSQY